MTLDIFGTTPLQKKFPSDMQKVVDMLATSPSQIECLKTSFRIMTDRYHGDRLKTFTHVHDLFRTDISYLRSRKFLHCTNSNYLLRHLLVGSGLFTDDDIVHVWTLMRYIAPHQYLKVRVSGIWIDVDIRAHSYGIQFGDHSYGFHGYLFNQEGKTSSS